MPMDFLIAIVQLVTLAGLLIDGDDDAVDDCVDFARTQGLSYWKSLKRSSSDGSVTRDTAAQV